MHHSPAAQRRVSISQPIIQAVWLTVEETGRERRYNLRNNNDGTFTHTKTGVNYHDTGKKTLGGDVLYTPINSIAPTHAPPISLGSSTTHDPKNVLFAIREGGKIEYLGNTGPNRVNNAGNFLEMDPASFAIFKNGGKRSESHKILDPVSLTKYYYDGKNFYDWDAKKLSGKGTAVDTKVPFGQKQSPNDILVEKLKKGELVDRRRDDRSSKILSPFDVGPYKSNVTMEKESDSSLSRTFPKLTGIEAWTSKSSDTNRDHVPSGESLNQRGGDGAYNKGFTIAIPNREMHQPFSPTYGTDNSLTKGMNDEKDDGSTQKRVYFDSENPATAFYKDTSYMLDKTSDMNYSSSHMDLDLSKSVNRARQIGAYRHLFRRNVRLNKLKGSKFGIDPSVKGMDYTVRARTFKKKPKKATNREGVFKYMYAKKKTQGQLIAEMLKRNLLKKKLAQDI